MKTQAEIARFLGIRPVNEDDYRTRVVHELLTFLGVPKSPPARWPLLPIRNPAGTGPWRPDFVLVVEPDLPMVVIEVKPRARQFADALREAHVYARNFEPVDAAVRRMTPPFLIAAAGSEVRMYRGRTVGLNVVYEEILRDGQPALLEWHEIEEAARAVARPEVPVGRVPGLAALARRLFEDAHAALYAARALRKKDDERIHHLCKILEVCRDGGAHAAERYALTEELGTTVASRLRAALDPYKESVASGLLSGSEAAMAFREFLTSDVERRGLKLFTGSTQYRPVLRGSRVVYRKTGRYFTPTEVVRQMVRLAGVRPSDRVIDPCCGSGGFLGHVLHQVQTADPGALPSFAADRLVGVDDDPFCVTATRAFLTLFIPQFRDRWRVYLHNCLYEEPPADGELRESAEAGPALRPGLYDVVISNPPGNKGYSGSNGRFVAKLWEGRYGPVHDVYDHVFFIRRALELARPDGGRVCLLVPDGFLSNEKFQALRDEVFRDCAVHAVVALPRVFRNNSAQMSILFAVRGERRTGRKVMLGEVRESAVDPESGESELVLFAELEAVVDGIVGGSAPAPVLRATQVP